MSENHVVNACMRWLIMHGVFCWRQNTGAYKTDKGAYVRYGFKGSPDIVGMMPAKSKCPGKFIGVECKTEKGKLSPHQRAFGAQSQESGGLYIVARSVDDLENLVRPLL